jgi:23S rRNA (adenine2503-C2)-methyltransferase
MIEPKRPKPPKHWSDWTVEERKAQVIELGLPGFRADQFSRQWYQRLNDDTASWTDVPADMREVVKDLLFPDLMTSIRELKCDNGTTVKQVWKLFDGVLVESVLMRYTDRVTMCISSQAGCGMNCPFCATGQSGLTRNLTTAEIL